MYRISKLIQELISAGLPVIGVAAVGEETGGLVPEVRIDWAVEPAPEQQSQAETILATHDPRDLLAEEAQAACIALHEEAADTLADFQTALDTWATLTAAQQKAVLKRCVQVEVALIKLLRHL